MKLNNKFNKSKSGRMKSKKEYIMQPINYLIKWLKMKTPDLKIPNFYHFWDK